MARIRRHIIYHGQVQGVGFRATAASIARQHPVAGWVRNLADGTVELEIEGTESDVQAALDGILEEMCWNITIADTAEIDVRDESPPFSIRR